MTYERIRKKGHRKIPRGLVFALIAINAELLYALTEQQIFFRIFIFGIFLTGFSFLISIVRKGAGNEIKQYSPWLMVKYAKITRRYIIAGTFGLIFAIIVISQAFLVPPSINQYYVQSQIDKAQVPGVSIQRNYFDKFPSAASIDSLIQFYKEKVTNRGIDISEVTYITTSVFASSRLDVNVSTISYFTPIVGIPSNIYTDLLSQLSVDKNLENIFLYDEEAFGNLEVSSLIFDDINNNTYSIQVNASKGFATRNLLMEFFEENRLPTPTNWGGFGLVISDINDARDIVSLVKANLNIGAGDLVTIFEASIWILYSGKETATEFLDKIRELNRDVQNTEISGGYASVPIISVVNSSGINFVVMRLLISFFSAPVIALSLFLIYFSVNLVKKRKEKLIGIMQVRGISDTQIGSMLFFEFLVSSVIAIVVGMVLAIPYTQFSAYFYKLSQGLILYERIIIPSNWYKHIPLIGMILSFDLNVSNIFTLINITVEEAEISEETKKPFWQKIYLDIILFGIGTVQVFIFNVLTINVLPDFILILLFLTIPFGIIGLILGSSLMVERYFPSFAGMVSDLLWIRRGDMFALATRNLRKSRFSASRLASVFVFSIMITGTFLILPNSLDATANATNMYSAGAAGYIEVRDSTQITSVLNKASAIEGIEKVSVIRIGYYYDFDFNTKMLIVDTKTIADVLYWKDSFADSSLRELIKSIETQNSILMGKEFLELENKKVGDTIQIATLSNRKELKIVGEFNLFPIVMTTKAGSFFAETPVVISQDTFTTNFGSYEGLDTRILLKFSPGADSDKIREEVHQQNLGGVGGEFFDSDTENVFFTTINTTISSFLIITIATAIVAIGYFAFISIEDRKKEIGVLRALGMVSNQIFRLLIVEALFILFSALIFGSGMVFLMVNYFMGIIFFGEGTYTIIIKEYVIPMSVYWYTIGLVVLSTIAAFIPTKMLASKETGSVLREE